MTDRLKGCWVAFEEDIREDDAQAMLNAIRHVRGVQAVTRVVADADDWMNRQRIRSELLQELYDVLHRKRE